MYCRKCGKQIPDDSEFCKYCGADLRTTKDTQNDLVESKSIGSIPESEKPVSVDDKKENDLSSVEEKNETSSPEEHEKKQTIKSEQYEKKSAVKDYPAKKNNSKFVAVIVICIVVIAILLVVIVGQNKKGADNTNDKPKVAESAKPTADTKKSDSKNSESADKTTESDMKIKQLSDYKSINDEISAEALTMSNKVKNNSEKLTATINENYDNLKANQQAITDFYTTTQSDSKLLYNNINEYCKMSYKLMISSGDINNYEKWEDAMSDLYKVWNDEMSAYYKSWNRSMEDVYKSWNRACDNASDGTDYQEKSDLWDAKYKEYEDSWDNLYNQYEDAWEALYDQYEDVYEDFSDKKTNIDDDLKASIAE